MLGIIHSTSAANISETCSVLEFKILISMCLHSCVIFSIKASLHLRLNCNQTALFQTLHNKWLVFKPTCTFFHLTKSYIKTQHRRWWRGEPRGSQQYRQKHGKPRMLCRYRKLSTFADSPKCENRMPLIHNHYWNLHCVRSVEVGFVMYSHANSKDYF